MYGKLPIRRFPVFSFGGMDMVTINGTAQNAAGMVLLDCLTGAGYSLGRIAVARNGEIVPKAQYDKVILEDGDTVEVVSFVGGG